MPERRFWKSFQAGIKERHPKQVSMERQIIDLIEDEVNMRVVLQTNMILEKISKTYNLPMDRLVKDTTGIECMFCKGVLKSKRRCLKTPQHNGYCKFHQCQVPTPSQKPHERVEAPWQMT